MDRKIVFAPEKMPTWDTVVKHLAGKNVPVQMRMIDGQLAFPDEQPPDAWNELRLGAAGSMITLRREPDGVRLVIWGNADAAVQQAWQTVAESFEELTR